MCDLHGISLDILGTIGNIAVLFLIALLNGFFTASGFALVKVRSTQIEELVVKGNLRARMTKSILKHLDVYLSATQFGNVLTSIALGWLGEPFVARALTSVFENMGIVNPAVVKGVSFGIAFGLVTFLNIIFGELVPKSIAIQKARTISLWIAYPLKIFFTIFRPFIVILDVTASLILRILGIRAASEAEIMHSTQELRLLLSQEKGVSEVNKALVLNALDFRLKQARHVMTPRPEIVALSSADPVQENIEIMRKNKFSRYPVYRESIDDIIGIVHTKDVFKTEVHRSPGFKLSSVLREAVFLPETVKLEKVLETMLHRKTHIAVLVDEYGGTAGLISLEDVLEELVGMIQDEFDRETPEVTKISDDEFLVDASMTTHDVEQLVNKEFTDMDILSLGAYIIEQLGHIPSKGEAVLINGIELTVTRVEDRVIEMVRVRRLPEDGVPSE